MEEQDFRKIEEMFQRQTEIISEDFQNKLQIQSEIISEKFHNKFQRQTEIISENFQNKLHAQTEIISEKFQNKINAQTEIISEKFQNKLQLHMGILSEDFQHKLDLVVEGQQMLAEKLDETRTELKDEIRKVDNRLTMVEARLEMKIDNIAAELSAHRADTEAHELKGYRVREEL